MATNSIEKLKYNLFFEDNEKKYNLLHNFISVFSPKKINCVSDFKKICIDDLDKTKIENALENYGEKLEKEFNFKLDEKKKIKKILNHCLSQIDYSIQTRVFGDKKYLNIFNKNIYADQEDNGIKTVNIKSDLTKDIMKVRSEMLNKYKDKKKVFVEFLCEFDEEYFVVKSKNLDKIKINCQNITNDIFMDIFNKNREKLETELNVTFQKISLISVIEKCLFKLEYIIKKEKNIISFISDS